MDAGLRRSFRSGCGNGRASKGGLEHTLFFESITSSLPQCGRAVRLVKRLRRSTGDNGALVALFPTFRNCRCRQAPQHAQRTQIRCSCYAVVVMGRLPSLVTVEGCRCIADRVGAVQRLALGRVNVLFTVCPPGSDPTTSPLPWASSTCLLAPDSLGPVPTPLEDKHCA